MRYAFCLGLFGMLVGGPLAAATFKDVTFGLTAEIPQGYTLEHREFAQAVDLYLTKPGTDTFCSVLYVSGQTLVGTQAQINVRAKPLLDSFVADTRKDAIVTAVAPFVLGGVEGISLETTDKRGQDRKRRFEIAYLATTKGHAQFACGASPDAFAAAKPEFDRLLRSVHLP